MNDQPVTKPKSPFPFTRVILLFVLFVAIVGLIFDRMARSKKEAGFLVIDQLLSAEDAGTDAVDPDVVHEKLGRQPDAPIAEVAGDMQETYTWRGVFRSYGFHVRYTRAIGVDDGKEHKPILTSVEDIAGGDHG